MSARNRVTPGSREDVIAKMRSAERAALKVAHTTPRRKAELVRIRDRHAGTTADAQQQRMVDAISTGGVTVIEARELLLCSNPSDCIGRLPDASKDTIRRTRVLWRDAMGNERETVRYAPDDAQ